MPQVDLIDETFIAAPPSAVAGLMHDAYRWRLWWPDLHLSIAEDRRVEGLRWNVIGRYVGTMEVWIEPFADGAIVHYYVRLDPAEGRLSDRVAAREIRRRTRHGKRVFWAVKDELEAGRAPGEPVEPVGSTGRHRSG